MEEDIKILEEKLKQWEPYKNIRFKTEIELELQKENQAIEHLLKKYKKKEALIQTMQAEFERLENLEDNTDMLKLELQKKDKLIEAMAEEILYENNCKGEFDFELYKDTEEVIEDFKNKVEREVEQ